MLHLIATAASGARAGELQLRHGRVPTPTFMPVATHAHVRHLTMQEVAATGAGICLANTYHLMQAPGTEVFERSGGIHQYMSWSSGVLTDSGGFQIFSLPGERVIEEEGARFRAMMLSPEASIAAQQAIGSDIMMVLDVCVPSTSDAQVTRDAMQRTHRWALRSLQARTSAQALFAIVQGGVFSDMRRESAAFLAAHPFDGFAIGGLAVGESRDELYDTTLFAAPLLPADKPRYLMGVGTPSDLVEGVNAGVDMFDCILPTMMAEQSYAYTFEGPLRLSRSEFREHERALDQTCGCPTCAGYSRAYLYHLTQTGQALATRLIAQHNLWHYQALMQRMRDAIIEQRWDSEYRTLRELLFKPSKLPRRVPGRQNGAFELVTLPSGARAVRHRDNGEVMHPIGPWQEANALYVEQTGLASLLALETKEPLRILDIGLGAAANAIAALTCAQTHARRPLEIVSLEVDLDALRLALTDADGFPFLQPWRSACDALLAHHHWQSDGLSWRVLVGNAQETLTQGAFDIIFFDPFSPPTNPGLWTVAFAKQVRSFCTARAQLVTYSAATPTRIMLLLAGFHVGHGTSTGTRTETTIAATDKTLLRDPLGERFLQRWNRSSARGAHDVPFSAELEQQVLARVTSNAPPAAL